MRRNTQVTMRRPDDRRCVLHGERRMALRRVLAPRRRGRAEALGHRLAAGLVMTFAALAPLSRAAAQAPVEGPPDPGLEAALSGFYAGLEARDVERARGWLAPGFFYIAPWGELELADEMLGRYKDAFAEGRLRDYRPEVRAVHTGSAGEGALWFRAIVREKYLRESGRRARNAFAEDLLTSGVAVREDGHWRIRVLHQTWSDETLRKMVPILHAAQPADPEEY